MKMKEFTAFSLDLAEKSAQLIRPYFAGADLAVEIKEDKTPVTQADREAEALMRELIRKRYPGHGIIGEEFGEEDTSAEFVWTLDPIDGTVSFARGCPLFGTMIGLLHGGRPVLGVINLPVLDRLCVGTSSETRVNGRVVQLREVGQLSDATLLTTDIACVAKSERKRGFEKLVEQTQLFRTWGDCFGYVLVVSGGADIMLDCVMSSWDIQPLIPIIQGANGVITTWSGTEAGPGKPCLVANSRLHPQVLGVLNG